MRLFFALLLLPLIGSPALAQSPEPTQTSAPHKTRVSAQEHFTEANTTHDGRLTLDQASSGYKSIAKSFQQIDVSHHGYVTMDDIKAWRAAKKAARQAAKHAASDASDASDAVNGIVRPVPATRQFNGAKALDTSTDMVAPGGATPRRIGVDLPAAPLDGQQPS
jgi:hypothetical protein